MLKKVLLSVVALMLALSFACKPDTDRNNNVSNANVQNSNMKNSNENSNVIDSFKRDDKAVRITISEGTDGKCVIATPDPDTIYVKKNQDKIVWEVTVNCKPDQATVTIDNFRYGTDPKMKNPFGDNSDADNTFVFEPGSSGRQKTSKFATGANASYKYRIRVTGTGNVLLAELDPVVIVGE